MCSSETRRVETDAVVVGAGTAGIAFAISAAANGHRVVAVEKSDRVGGTLFVTGGHLSAAETRRQRAAGIEDSTDDHFADVMAIGNQQADAALVRLAVEEAPRTVDWLDDLGFPFAPETPAQPDRHEHYSAARTYWAEDRGRSILRTIRPLWDRHVTAGRIRVLLEHECDDVLVDDDGTVRGVHATGPDGAVTVRAPTTVLATGGYGANPEFFERVSTGSPPLVTNARESTTGDGLEIAVDHGAQFRNADLRVPTLGGIETESGSGRTDYTDRWARVTPSEDRVPHEIYVTEAGERFVAEDAESFGTYQRALLDRSIHRFWVVFDERALEWADPPVVSGRDREGIRTMADGGDIAWRADTLDALAERAGIDPTGLAATVQTYNDAVATGDDPFDRSALPAPIDDPPFYAIETHDTTLATHGGLAVDDHLRVLDRADDPIPGLFAIGEAIGGGALTGQDFGSGMLLTPALSFGRLLGRRLHDWGPDAA
jgi:fumarate reductase flavoprotein subunit